MTWIQILKNLIKSSAIIASINLTLLTPIWYTWNLLVLENKPELIDVGYFNVIAFFALLIISMCVSFLLRWYADIATEKERLNAFAKYNDNFIVIDCGACKSPNTAHINPSTNNDFTCIKCGTRQNIEVKYDTIVQTDTNVLTNTTSKLKEIHEQNNSN